MNIIFINRAIALINKLHTTLGKHVQTLRQNIQLYAVYFKYAYLIRIVGRN